MRILLACYTIALLALMGCGEDATATAERESAWGPPPMSPIMAASPVDADHPFEIAGRVVDVRGEGWPDEPPLLRLKIGDERWERPIEPDGSFSFGLSSNPEQASLWLHRLRGGWRWTYDNVNYPITLTPPQLSGAEPIVLGIAERRVGWVHGMAVDKDSGDPLPHFPFKLAPTRLAKDSQFAYGTIWLQTDADGRFRLEQQIIGGRTAITPNLGDPKAMLDHSDCLTSPTPDGPPWIIKFNAGQRLPVELNGAVPGQLSSLKVQILTSRNPLRRLLIPLHRMGTETWIFTGNRSRQGDLETVLAVGSDDGLVFGFSRLQSNPSGEWACEPITLEATGGLALEIDMQPLPRVDGEDYDPPSAWPLVQVEPINPESKDSTWAFRSEARRYLPPGDYDINLATRSHIPELRRVRIDAGETTMLKLELKLEPHVRSLHAIVRTESGAPIHDFRATIQFQGTREGAWYAEYHFQPGITCGTGVDYYATIVEGTNSSKATFDIHQIPKGLLEASARSDEYPCDTQLTECENGNLILEVLIRDLPSNE